MPPPRPHPEHCCRRLLDVVREARRATVLLTLVLALAVVGPATAATTTTGTTTGTTSGTTSGTGIVPAVRHLHSSSFLRLSPESLAADLARWRTRNDLITLTEVSTPARGAVLDAPGWGTWWSPGGAQAENAVLWDESVWELLDGRHQQVTEQRAYTRRGSYPIGWAATVLLGHRGSGRTVLVSALHLPSLVERNDGTGFRTDDNPLRVATYQDAMRGWRAHVDDLRSGGTPDTASVVPDAVVLAADWNIDLRRGWARRWLREQWAADAVPEPGLSRVWDPTWKRPFPRRGTFEDVRLGRTRHRLIDASLVEGVQRVRRSRVLRDVASSDHHPVRERWSLG